MFGFQKLFEIDALAFQIRFCCGYLGVSGLVIVLAPFAKVGQLSFNHQSQML
jgi:hypothetical protein